MENLQTPLPAPAKTSPALSSCCSTPTFPPNVIRFWMRDWRVLAGVGLVVGGLGLAVGWHWLTAVGIAPLIVSATPCLVMCALGGCMMARGDQANAAVPGSAVGQPASPPDREAS